MNDKVPERETKRADELAKGDWIAAGPYTSRIDGTDDAEVLHTHSYGDAAVAATIQEVSVPEPLLIHLRADAEITLLTPAEIAAHRELLDREKRIADMRAMVDWLEAHPEFPIERFRMQVSPDPHGDVWNSGAEGVAEVRRLAVVAGAEVVSYAERTEFTKTFGRTEYCLVAWHKDGRPAEPKRGTTCEELEDDDPTGQLYSRAVEADDPTPVSGARIPAHLEDARTGEAVEVETSAAHGESSGWKGNMSGTCGVECYCGTTYDGFDTLAEAKAQLALHVEAATSPTGLTKAADESRGPLAFTTPVVTYFSFGHGQTDPSTGEKLIDHYVTVVAPTYEACREAMFASRFGNRWAFDYLAGTKQATEWIPRWTEHEVIVAPDTDPSLVGPALKAARELVDPGDAA